MDTDRMNLIFNRTTELWGSIYERTPDGLDIDEFDHWIDIFDAWRVNIFPAAEAKSLTKADLNSINSRMKQEQEKFDQIFNTQFFQQFGMDFDDFKEDEEEEDKMTPEEYKKDKRNWAKAQMALLNQPKRTEAEKQFTAERDRLHNLQKQKTQKFTQTP